MFERHGSAMLEASAVSLGASVGCNNWAFERSVRCLTLEDPRESGKCCPEARPPSFSHKNIETKKEGTPALIHP